MWPAQAAGRDELLTMPCETCNAATTIKDSTEHTGNGSFREHHKCARGHTGTITGEESDPPTAWRRSGAVFEDYGV